MKLINFKTEKDKKALSPEQILGATNLEINNKVREEVYLCMINPEVDSTLFIRNTNQILYTSMVLCIFPERKMESGKTRWVSTIFYGNDKECEDFTPDKLTSSKGYGPFREFTEGYGDEGLKNILDMAKFCYGAIDRTDFENKRDTFYKNVKNKEIQK